MYSETTSSVILNDESQIVTELKWEIKDLKEENAKLRELVVQGITSLIFQ